MRALLGLAGLAAGCGFHHGAAVSHDATPVDGVEADTSDGSPPARVGTGLVGFWTFDDLPGSTQAADTSGAGVPVGLQVALGTPSFVNGTLIIDAPARLASAPAPHQNHDCSGAGAVTLEAWITSAQSPQGSATAPVLIAGLSGSINSRNVSLLQAGSAWEGRVRTTADVNGMPALDSSSSVGGEMTHLVLVADAGTRSLYVNDQLEAQSPAAALVGWDSSYRMLVGDEYEQSRPWLGKIALVAIYDIALTPAQVQQNFMAGPAQ